MTIRAIDIPPFARTIRRMDATALRHIALLAAGPLGSAPNSPRTIVEAASRAAALAGEAFAAAPGLEAFSFIAPDIDRLVGEPQVAAESVRDCVDAARILEEAATRCGGALRLCGPTDDLPEALARHAVHPPAAAAGRTLLWFLRYGGRGEIARAATRFFHSRPAATLGDDELSAWLDTSGVPDPDLIVMAGGPFDVPDAFVWQGSYAELWHTAKPWAAFDTADLRRAIADFTSRQRRFGG